MNKQKIVFFFLPNFGVGGAGNSIKNICKLISNKKYKIHAISLGKNYYKEDLKKINVDVIELKKTKTVLSILKIKKIIEKKYHNKEIVFVSNINYANVLSCIFLNKIKNIKLVIIERTPINELKIYFNFIDMVKKKLIKFLMKLYYKNANYIIGNSSNLSNDLKKEINCNVKTLIPFIKINNIKKKYNKRLKILWIGRNSPEKNIDDFLNCLKYLEKLDINIIIVTDKKHDEILSCIPDHFKKRTKLLSFINNTSFISKLYKKTDIMVSTSIYEGFPNVIAESINNECLVITSNSYGGYNEMVKNNEYGLIYKTKNYLELSKKLNYAVKNFDLCKKKILLSKKNLILLSKKNNQKYKEFFKKI